MIIVQPVGGVMLAVSGLTATAVIITSFAMSPKGLAVVGLPLCTVAMDTDLKPMAAKEDCIAI
jgi:hypothetical protein